MTVSADFQGIYGLGQDSTTIECKSTGTLEDNILALAGAQCPPHAPQQRIEYSRRTGFPRRPSSRLPMSTPPRLRLPFRPPSNCAHATFSACCRELALHPALQTAFGLSRPRCGPGTARRSLRTRAAGSFLRRGRSGPPLNPFQAWMLHLPLTADRHLILWHACVFTGVMMPIAIPYGTRAGGVWDLDPAADDESVPRRSVYAAAGIESAFSFGRKNR